MKNKLLILVVIGALSLFGCSRLKPVHNINNAPITAESAQPEDIKNAIINAGSTLGWSMKATEDGVIDGTLILRRHVANIKVTYSQTEYSIQYKDSENLGYNGTKIHPNYNGWIQNLDRAIRALLGRL